MPHPTSPTSHDRAATNLMVLGGTLAGLGLIPLMMHASGGGNLVVGGVVALAGITLAGIGLHLFPSSAAPLPRTADRDAFGLGRDPRTPATLPATRSPAWSPHHARVRVPAYRLDPPALPRSTR